MVRGKPADGCARSRDALIGKDFRPQIDSRHAVVCGPFNEGPPLSLEKGLVGEPVRDCLLRDTGVPDLSHAVSQSSLAPASDRDRSPERGNVRFLHDAREYTRILVSVNKNRCLTTNKGPCTVLDMPTTKRKPEVARARSTPAPDIGKDGLTFSQRVRKLMSDQSPPLGQSELARLCSEYYATYMPGSDEKVKQQHVFNLLRGQGSVEYLPLLAAVFDVNELWLQYGIGPKERNSRS